MPAPPDRVFSLLLRPSAIRAWWGARRAIVLPAPGGAWAAAWGDDEDDPEYVTFARIRELDRPHRLVLDDYVYGSKEGPLPFEAAFVTTFEIEPRADGCLLRVVQDGFPGGAEGDAFLAACESGWRTTFAGIRRVLSGTNATGPSG